MSSIYERAVYFLAGLDVGVLEPGDVPPQWVDAVIFAELGRRERERDEIKKSTGKPGAKQAEGLGASNWRRHLDKMGAQQ